MDSTMVMLVMPWAMLQPSSAHCCGGSNSNRLCRPAFQPQHSMITPKAQLRVLSDTKPVNKEWMKQGATGKHARPV